MAVTPIAKQGILTRVLDVVGRTMIAAGLLLLSFVAYQLWGTGVAEQRAQTTLAADFRSQRPATPVVSGLVGRINIPSIELEKFVVAGVSTDDLKRGPGLFLGSPLPGQLGNVSIAGHRTTYGAPFGRINEVKKGDRIVLETTSGTFTYVSISTPKIVPATAIEVVKTKDPTKATLTLVSCHPKWTSAKRIIVMATLDESVVAQPATPIAEAPTSTAPLSEGWFHDPSAWPTVIALASALVAIFLFTKRLARRRKRRLVVYPLSLIVFGPVLFVFFENLSRLLPANL
jgi:sortase A